MERFTGVKSIGIRGPIIREGDNLCDVAVDSLLLALNSENIKLNDKDVYAITESVVARAEGNYATIDDIASDIKEKYKNETIGVISPITSRNRFAVILRGIARGAKKIVLMLSYPSDEVGNAILTLDELDEKNINPYSDVLTLSKFRELFGYKKHEFTGINYVEYYKSLIENENCECEIIFANNPRTILKYTDSVLAADIHTRNRTKRILKEAGAKIVFGLDDILTKSINGSGYNEDYGLLGSNKSTDEKIKLFPTRKCQRLVKEVQDKIYKLTNKKIEVMVYGDGAFKDPKGKIWELADPVVSPAFTDGLIGTPNEIKIKYLADNEYGKLNGDDLKEAIKTSIKNKDNDLKGNMASVGTTPRQLTDLLGSLADLTSGSGDKGTPFILIQGYFDNYTND